MFLHSLCGSYFPVKRQEVIEMRTERNSWLMSSWFSHPNFLLCLFSSFWHLGEAHYFHTIFYDHISRQRRGEGPLVRTMVKESKEKIICDPCKKTVSDCWDLLFLAIPTINIPRTLSFNGLRSSCSLTSLTVPPPDLKVLARLGLFYNKEKCTKP